MSPRLGCEQGISSGGISNGAGEKRDRSTGSHTVPAYRCLSMTVGGISLSELMGSPDPRTGHP